MESLSDCFSYGLKSANNDGLLDVFRLIAKIDSSLQIKESQVLDANDVWATDLTY